MPSEEMLGVTLRKKKTSVLFLIHILFIIVLSGTDKKNSESLLFITVLSTRYQKIWMSDWIMHLTQLENLQFCCLEYLTLLMCFGIGNYTHMYVVQKLLW
jgi:hypothetical protein